MDKTTAINKLIEDQGCTTVNPIYAAQELATYEKEHLMKCSPKARETFKTLFSEGLEAGLNPQEIVSAFRDDVKAANQKFWVARRSAKSPLAKALVDAGLVRAHID